jgi:hypothetical protein
VWYKRLGVQQRRANGKMFEFDVLKHVIMSNAWTQSFFLSLQEEGF